MAETGINAVYSKIDEWLQDKVERYQTVDAEYPSVADNSTFGIRKTVLKREIALLQSVKTIIKQECFEKKEDKK